MQDQRKRTPVHSDLDGIFFWTNKLPGDRVEGYWRGRRKHTWKKSGDTVELGMMDTAEGPALFPIPGRLASKLDDIEVGKLIEIIYRGMVSSRAGRPAHDFEVNRIEGDLLFEETPSTDDDGAPF
jgi:hypothetical protein